MSDEGGTPTPAAAWDAWLRSRQIPAVHQRRGRAPALNPENLNDAELDALMRSFGPSGDRVRALEAELAAARPVVERITAALTAAREHRANVERLVREALVHRAALAAGDGNDGDGE